eukprot:m.264885 g.264885  ORF g.264885 m.264885 type:complete len:64 (+) comp40481_c0_seq10:715-906(+)
MTFRPLNLRAQQFSNDFTLSKDVCSLPQRPRFSPARTNALKRTLFFRGQMLWNNCLTVSANLR